MVRKQIRISIFFSLLFACALSALVVPPSADPCCGTEKQAGRRECRPLGLIRLSEFWRNLDGLEEC